MKRLLAVAACIIAFACSNGNDEYKQPENALDAGRSFIENSLKGRFLTAKRYMIEDQENVYWLDKVSTDYNKMSEEEKSGLARSSINIREVTDVSDSITIINYSNSYKNRTQKVQVVKFNDTWLVDFKHTFSAN